MDTNYRSSKNVVEQVNRWFEETMEGYTAQKSKPGASEGYVEVLESEELIPEAVAQAKKLLDLGVNVDEIAFLYIRIKMDRVYKRLVNMKVYIPF
jgi:exodeoxyribonuclease V beta subunit